MAKTKKTEKKELIEQALDYEKSRLPMTSTSERIIISKKTKELILSLNEIYKENKDPEIMDIMKRLTVIKQKAEKRLKLRI